jgi:hypothetical protein
MRHICQLLDDAGRPGDKPTIAELRTLFQSEPVQAVFDPIRTTCTGQIRRVEQIHWDSITRLLLKAKANPHAVTQNATAIFCILFCILNALAKESKAKESDSETESEVIESEDGAK